MRPCLYGKKMARLTISMPQSLINEIAVVAQKERRASADMIRIMLQDALQRAVQETDGGKESCQRRLDEAL